MTMLQHLPVLACTGFALLLARRAGLLPSVGLFVASGCVLFGLFAGALVGVLLPTAVLILAGGLFVLVYEIYRLYAARQYPPLTLVLFVAASTLFWLAHNDASFFFYDAFSHWGIFLKEMLALDGLWGADSNSVHPKYPPGPTLWQYLFARFSPAIEGASFHAQFVLLIAPLMVLIEGIRSRAALWVILISILAIILLFNFGHGIQSVYVDHVLGAWVAGSLVAFVAMLYRGAGRELTWLAVPIAAICLLKSTGIFFVLVAAGCVFVAGGVNWFVHTTPARAQSLIVASAAVLLAVGTTFAWNENRDAAGVQGSGTTTDGLLANLARGDSMFSDEQQAEISARFIDVVTRQQLSKGEVSTQFHAFNYTAVALYTDSFRLTTLSLLLISLGFIVLGYMRLADARIRHGWAACATTLWLGTVAYLVMLYVGYVYISESDNGLILSSYIRYSHSLILPLVIVVLAVLFPVLGERPEPDLRPEKERTTSLAVAAAVTLLLGVFETPYLKFLYTTQRSPDIRFAIEPTTAGIRDTIGGGALQVFVDFNDPNGFLRHMMRYQLTPGWASVDFADAAFIEDTTRYFADRPSIDYLWIAAGDSELLAAATTASGNPDARVFRVNRDADGPMLIPVLLAGPAE